MKLPKLVLAFVFALGMSFGLSVAAGAQIEGDGAAIHVTKQCGPGVTGTATFDATITFPDGQPETLADALSIDCDTTEDIPAGAPIGTIITLHESSTPDGAVTAADKTVTVTASEQSITIVNDPPRSGGLSIDKVCPTGFNGTATFSVAFTLANDENGGTSTVAVPCGHTVAVSIPAGADFTNTTFSAHEATAPLGTKADANQSGQLSADAQTLTFTDAALAGPAGALQIHQTCATGVVGTAHFSVAVTPVGAATQTITLPVECGATTTVRIPDSADLTGSAVTVHETTPATHGAPAADVTRTLTADGQTVTIDNALLSLSIHKTCASGVSGSAAFVVTVSAAEEDSANVSVGVPCGQTVAVAIPARLTVLRAAVKIHESTAPTKGIAGADVNTTLTAANQTVTINNTAGPVVLPATGGAQQPEPDMPALMLGLILIMVGGWMAFFGDKIAWRSNR